MECKHLKESRKSLDTDFYGYFEKYLVVAANGETAGCFFVKQCHECAVNTRELKHTREFKLVARAIYMCLSEHTTKAMNKNLGTGYRIVSVSDRAKRLAEEAEAEGPDTIN